MSSIAQIGSVPVSLIPKLQQRLEEGLQEIRDILSTLGPQSKPKQIHDIRIATRRQRVLCRVLQLSEASPGFQQLEKPLKKLTKKLSPVRSWDVSARQLKTMEQHWRQEGKKGFGFLRKILKKHVQSLRRKDLNKIAKENFFRAFNLKAISPHWDLLSAGAVETRLLNQTSKVSDQVLKNWRNYQRTRAMSDLHEVRISFKKLRYFLEIQHACLGHPQEELFARLKSLQDELGYIHDLYVLRSHLKEKVIRKMIPSDKKGRFRAVAKYLKETEDMAVKSFTQGEATRLPGLLKEALG